MPNKYPIALLVKTNTTDIPALLQQFFVSDSDYLMKANRVRLGNIINNLAATDELSITDSQKHDMVHGSHYDGSVLAYAKSEEDPSVIFVRTLNGLCTIRLEILTEGEFNATNGWFIQTIDHTEYIATMTEESMHYLTYLIND